jgi:hypothetical protein
MDSQVSFFFTSIKHGYHKKKIGPKMCQLFHVEETTMLFGKELQGMVEDIVVGGGHFIVDLK